MKGNKKVHTIGCTTLVGMHQDKSTLKGLTSNLPLVYSHKTRLILII
jgi:hypothetical protein